MIDEPIQIELLGRPGCHLCDDAFEILREHQQELGFRVVKVDITGNLDYLRRFRNDIPVALIDGRELFRHRITPAELRQKLEQPGWAPGPG